MSIILILQNAPQMIALASDVMIYNNGGNICDYIDGEGAYFSVERNIYTDVNGRVAYCIEPDVIGADVNGTDGYFEGALLYDEEPELIRRLNNVAVNGYPMGYVDYEVDNDNFIESKKGLIVNNTFFECTPEEARAVTAFVIHKTIYDYYMELGEDKSSYEIKSYRNGSLAKHDLVQICSMLLEDAVRVKENPQINIRWGSYTDGVFYEQSNNQLFDQVDISESGTYNAWAEIDAKNCFVNDVRIDETLNSGDANIADIRWESPSKVLVQIVFTGRQMVNSEIGIECSGIQFFSDVMYYSHYDLQDVMIIPDNKRISEKSSFVLEAGSTVIYKYDLDSEEAVAGVKFGVYSDIACELLEKEIITDSDGYAYIDEIPEGRYFIKELSCPRGYMIDDTVYETEIKLNSVSRIEIGNRPYKLRLCICKNDTVTGAKVQGDASFAGAVYGIYAKKDILSRDGKSVLYQKNQLVQEVSLNDEGKVVVEDLIYGAYYVKEITPPEGYCLSGVSYEVKEEDFQSNPDDEFFANKTIVVKDDVVKQPFCIKKYYKDENNEKKALENAGFSAWLISELEKDENGNPIIGDETPIVIGENNEKEIFTDSEGIAKSIGLPYGEYIVRETSVPEGFIAVDDFVVNIRENSNKPQLLYELEDNQKYVSMKIIKCDRQTKKKISISGFGFKIKDKNTGKYITNDENGELKDVFFTNDEGIIYLKDSLLFGDYEIEEVCVPKDSKFVLNHEKVSVHIGNNTVIKNENGDELVEVNFYNEQILGNIEIVKKFERNVSGEILKRNQVIFALYAAEDIKSCFSNNEPNIYSKGELVERVELNEDKKAYINNLPLGKYKLVEEKTLSGYLLDKTEYPISISNGDCTNGKVNVSFQIENKITKLTFEKKDNISKKYVAGAKLAIFDKNGNVVDEWITDKNKHEVCGLEIGEKYILKEQNAPYGYIKSHDIEFIVNEASAIKPQNIVMYDDVSMGDIEIYKYGKKVAATYATKTDADSSDEFMPLQNVEFEIYANEDIKLNDIDNTIIYKKGDLVQKGITNEKGILLFKELYIGEYKIVETKTDAIHVLLEEPIIVSVKYKDQNTKKTKVDISLENKLTSVSVAIDKKDMETNETLCGVEFGIYAADNVMDLRGELLYSKDELISSKCTDENGRLVFSDLLFPGKYYVKENRALEGYVLDENIYEFNVTASKNTEVKFDITNRRCKIISAESEIKIKPDKDENAKTKDDTKIILTCSIMLVALCGIILLIKKSCRKN